MSSLQENTANGQSLTLGDLLYSEHRQNLVPERDWAALMQSIATGNQYALYVLYEWAHRIVFTLILRLTGDQKTAEELTIDVFYDLWQHASTYDAADGTVIAWVMNQAHESALSLLRPDQNGRSGAKARLAPGVDYPPHRHAGLEELHLLHGELWIDERKLYPGDYNRAEPGTSDQRVWSETGCTCLLSTSTNDLIG